VLCSISSIRWRFHNVRREFDGAAPRANYSDLAFNLIKSRQLFVTAVAVRIILRISRLCFLGIYYIESKSAEPANIPASNNRTFFGGGLLLSALIKEHRRFASRKYAALYINTTYRT
jgi:hypothetical protein